MTIQKVKNTKYDLQTFVGDSGTIIICNIPTDKEYTLYMEINGKKKVEKEYELHMADIATIQITVQDTEDLGEGQWPYGVKLCDGSDENTYIPDLRVAPNAYFVVRKKIVEGTKNGE